MIESAEVVHEVQVILTLSVCLPDYLVQRRSLAKSVGVAVTSTEGPGVMRKT